MANHATIYSKTGEFPSVEQIQADVEEIVKRKFPIFSIEYNPAIKLWFISYTDCYGDFGLQFWLDTHVIKWDEDTPLESVPCLEFRHGHSFNFLWWVEDEIRQGLARKYGFFQMDDGNGIEELPPEKEYKTYLEYLEDRSRYLNSNKLPDAVFEEWVQKYINYKLAMDFEKTKISKTLKPMLFGESNLKKVCISGETIELSFEDEA